MSDDRKFLHVGVTVVFLCTLIATASIPASAQGEPGFRIIVNQANPTTSLTQEQASRLFLKRDTTWIDGSEVVPVDLKADSPIRERFCKAVHGRPVAATKAYWQKLIFEGRAVPPPEKEGVAEVLEFVAANPGAIGYVDKATPLGDGVKEVAIRG